MVAPRVSSRSSVASVAATVVLAAAAVLLAGACASTPPPAAASAAESGAKTANVKPEALAGNWLLAVKMGERTVEGSLHFSLDHGVLAGTWTSAEGREWELSKIEIHGDAISWESSGPAGRMAASGKVNGTSMQGTMKRVPRSRDSAGSGSGGSSGSDSGDSSGDAPPSGDAGSGYGRGGRGRGMGRGGRGRAGSAGKVTWTAYKSEAPPS